MRTSKYRRLSSCALAEIPGTGSWFNRSISLVIRRGTAILDLVRWEGKESDFCQTTGKGTGCGMEKRKSKVWSSERREEAVRALSLSQRSYHDRPPKSLASFYHLITRLSPCCVPLLPLSLSPSEEERERCEMSWAGLG